MSASRRSRRDTGKKVPEEWSNPAYTIGDRDSATQPIITVRGLNTERVQEALERVRAQETVDRDDERGERRNDFLLNMAELMPADGQLEWDDQEMFPARTERDEFIRSKEEADRRDVSNGEPVEVEKSAVVTQTTYEPAEIVESPKPVEPEKAVELPKPVESEADRTKRADAEKCVASLLTSCREGNIGNWKKECVRLQWLADTWPQSRDIARHVCAVSAVLDFMKQHSEDSTVQCNGCMAVTSLCRHHSNNHAEFDAMHGFNVVLAALQAHGPLSEQVACHATQCLAVMSVPGRHDDTLKKYPELPDLVLDAMRNHLMHEAVQAAGCWALANMCCNVGINQEQMNSFGVAAILHAMDQWSTSCVVQREGCKALGNLFHDASNRDNLQSSGAMEEVHQSLKNCSFSPDVITTACISIATFASTDDLRLQLCELGVVNSIVGCMRTLSHSTSVQEAACWALANLITSETAALVVEEGVLGMIVNCLRRQPFMELLQSMGCMALYNIACSVSQRIHVVVAGGPEVAVDAIRHMPTRIRVLQSATKLLAVLCHDSPIDDPTEAQKLIEADKRIHQGRLAVLQCGGGLSIFYVMQLLPRDLEMHGLAMMALQQLSEHASSFELLGEESSLNALLDSASLFRNAATVIDRVLAILENITASETVVDRLLALGGLHLIVLIMRQHPGNGTIQTRASVSLARVAQAGPAGSFWLTSLLGGQDAAPPSNPIFSGSNDRAFAVAKAGGIWVLLSAMGQWPGSHQVQAACCQALACIAQNPIATELMVKGGVIQAILAAMADCPRAYFVQERGCTALLAVSSYETFAENLRQANGVAIVEDAQRMFPECAVIRYLVSQIGHLQTV